MKTAEKQSDTNSGLSPEKREMLESPKKIIKKSPVANLSKPEGKATRWDKSDADTANDFLQQNRGKLDRSSFKFRQKIRKDRFTR